MSGPPLPRTGEGLGVGTFALLLPILALVGFNLALAPRFGTLTATTMAQQSGWGRHLSWPWDGLLSAASALPSGAPVLRFTVVLDIGWTLLFVVLALATLRWLPLPYALYACATAALVLLTPMHKPGLPWAALASNGRFLLVVFPIFMLLARWSDGRRCYICSSSPFRSCCLCCWRWPLSSVPSSRDRRPLASVVERDDHLRLLDLMIGARRDNSGADGEELDDMGVPPIRAFEDTRADNALRANLLRLVLHAFHRQLARIIDTLRIVRHLDILPGDL